MCHPWSVRNPTWILVLQFVKMGNWGPPRKSGGRTAGKSCGCTNSNGRSGSGSEQVAASDSKKREGPECFPLYDVQCGRASDPNSDRNDWTLPKSISGHDRRWLHFVWLAYSAFFWIGPVLRNQLGYWIVFGCVYTLFLGLYSALVLGRTLGVRRGA